MKQLKPTTIKRYSIAQLVRHLDRYLAALDNPPFRVECGRIYQLSRGAYHYYCSTHDRADVVEVISCAYQHGGR